MPLYTGKSGDGSDIREFEGLHLSSCGNFFGNIPFTKEDEKHMRRIAYRERIRKLMNSAHKK